MELSDFSLRTTPFVDARDDFSVKRIGRRRSDRSRFKPIVDPDVIHDHGTGALERYLWRVRRLEGIDTVASGQQHGIRVESRLFPLAYAPIKYAVW